MFVYKLYVGSIIAPGLIGYYLSMLIPYILTCFNLFIWVYARAHRLIFKYAYTLYLKKFKFIYLYLCFLFYFFFKLLIVVVVSGSSSSSNILDLDAPISATYII